MKKLLLLFFLVCLPVQGQRFIQTFNKLGDMLSSNPQGPQTNAFIAGVATVNDGGQAVFTWVFGSTASTNASNCFQSTFIPLIPGRWIRQLYQSTGGGGGGGGTNGLPVVDTISDLVGYALAGHADTNVWVNGWRTPNDGGQGLFVRLISSAATNLGTVFPTAGDPTTLWFRQYTGELQSGWFGPLADGVTDDTVPLQSALTVVSNANGGTLILSGRMAVNSLIGSSNLRLVGTGGAMLAQLSGATYVLSVNPGSGGTTNVANNATNITVENIIFRGRCDTDGFSEHRPLLNLNAASDVTVDTCEFLGFQGDGIYIGSGNTAGIERHNERIRVLNCKFDGINYANRNGISVIDCNGLLIDKCYFTRMATNTMPGAVDFEPDDAWNVMKACSVTSCKFEATGGNYAAIGISLDTSTNQPRGFVIRDNFINSPATFGYYIRNRVAGATTNNMGIEITGNTVRNSATGPFAIAGVNGVYHAGNFYQGANQQAVIGLEATTNRVYNMVSTGNIYREFQGVGLQLSDVTGYKGRDETFIDIGNTGGGSGWAMFFSTAIATNVSLDNIRITSPLGRTTYGIKASGDYVFNPSLNWMGNVVMENGVTGNDFQAANSGTGSPQNTITAPQGALFSQRDGAATKTLWMKGFGTLSNGWQLVIGGTNLAAGNIPFVNGGTNLVTDGNLLWNGTNATISGTLAVQGTVIQQASTGVLGLQIGKLTSAISNVVQAIVGINDTGGPGTGQSGGLYLQPRTTSGVHANIDFATGDGIATNRWTVQWYGPLISTNSAISSVGATNTVVGSTKIVGTDSNGGEKGVALSGLSYDGTTLSVNAPGVPGTVQSNGVASVVGNLSYYPSTTATNIAPTGGMLWDNSAKFLSVTGSLGVTNNSAPSNNKGWAWTVDNSTAYTLYAYNDGGGQVPEAYWSTTQLRLPNVSLWANQNFSVDGNLTNAQIKTNTLVFGDTTHVMTSRTNFLVDYTNGYLGINTWPTTPLSVGGDAYIGGILTVSSGGAYDISTSVIKASAFTFQAGGQYIINGVGDPNSGGGTAGVVGSVYINRSGGTNTTLWGKVLSSGTTNWLPFLNTASGGGSGLTGSATQVAVFDSGTTAVGSAGFLWDDTGRIMTIGGASNPGTSITNSGGSNRGWRDYVDTIGTYYRGSMDSGGSFHEGFHITQSSGSADEFRIPSSVIFTASGAVNIVGGITTFSTFSAGGNYTTTANGLSVGFNEGPTIRAGTGAPSYSASKGSLYLRADGGAGACLYVNESGSTTWTAK